MNPRLQALLVISAALGFLFLLLFLLLDTIPITKTTTANTPPPSVVQTASVGAPVSTSTLSPFPPPPVKKPDLEPKKSAILGQAVASSSTNEIQRIANPYDFPASTFDAVNAQARNALVNILCMPNRGTLNPISGSGVIISPQGVILTNAHVAQYVLLSQSQEIDLTCMVRTGSPAAPQWRVGILYLPPVWVDAHVSEINAPNPMGTGEHDYALLSIISNMDGSPASGPFPYLEADTRNGIGFTNDQVLAAAYPAEFVGGIMAQNSLYPASSVTAIRQLLTFGSGDVDAFSIGGVVEAQAGSSGGAVVNAWNRLIGVISITSAGATTAERDLRAVTLSYIDKDINTQSGKHLKEYLNANPIMGAANFAKDIAPSLIQKYVSQLTH